MRADEPQVERCAWCGRQRDPDPFHMYQGAFDQLPDGQVGYHGTAASQVTNVTLAIHQIDGKDVLLCSSCAFLAARQPPADEAG